MYGPQTLPTKSRGPPQAQQQWAGNQTQGGPGTPDHGSSDEVRDDPIMPELFQMTKPKLQTPSPPHTDRLGASGNWHSGWTQSLVPDRHWSGLFTFNLF